MFERKGQIVIEAEGLNEDTVMEDTLEAGADDILSDGDVFQIFTDPNEVGKVAEALSEKGYTFLSAEAVYLPSTTTVLSYPESVEKMEKLLDMLDDNDDVQNVWHSWEMPADAE